MLVDTSDYSNGSHHASCVHRFWSYSLVPCNIIINDSTPSQAVFLMLLPNKSTVKYSLASHPHSILQYQSLSVSGHRGRVWGLKTAMCEPVREFTIANEIAEHIIRVDFDTWARSFIPCDWHSGSSFSQARGNLEYDLKAWQHWAVVSFMKSFFTTCKQGRSFCHPWICLCYGMEVGDGLQGCEKWQNSVIFTIDSVWVKN